MPSSCLQVCAHCAQKSRTIDDINGVWKLTEEPLSPAAALLFWWPVIGVWPYGVRSPRWTVIPYLVTADLVNTALSAVLSFSSHILYPTYAGAPRVLHLSAIDDQALAGVIMWVPGSIAFLLPALVVTMQLFEAGSRTDWADVGANSRRADSGRVRFRNREDAYIFAPQSPDMRTDGDELPTQNCYPPAQYVSPSGRDDDFWDSSSSKQHWTCWRS